MDLKCTLAKIQENLYENQESEQPSEIQLKEKDTLMSFGQWNEKQTLKYFLFIYHHRQKFQSKSMRKSLKVFKQMAKFVKTRNSSQCRTHHQNLMNKSKNIENALQYFIYQFPGFYDKYDKIKESLQILDDVEFCEDTSTVVKKPKGKKNLEAESSAAESREKEETEKIEHVIMQDISGKSKEEEMQEVRMQKFMQCQILFGLWMVKVASLSRFYHS